VACSLADALEQVMLVVEVRSEQESKRNLVLSRGNIANAVKRRIAKRVVDCVVVEELVGTMHGASYDMAQLPTYHPYLIGIVGKKLFYNISHTQSFSSRLESPVSSGASRLNCGVPLFPVPG
jgi:hypothetical protein